MDEAVDRELDVPGVGGVRLRGVGDPGFLGIVSADDDAVYLPLRKGSNELMLALSELGGGWGFVARLEEPR